MHNEHAFGFVSKHSVAKEENAFVHVSEDDIRLVERLQDRKYDRIQDDANDTVLFSAWEITSGIIRVVVARALVVNFAVGYGGGDHPESKTSEMSVEHNDVIRLKFAKHHEQWQHA